MALIVNTNLASLNAQNNLAKNQSALQTALQRLSSGLRVNSAKDDAAGLYNIAIETDPVSDEINVISYQLEVTDLQESGVYTNNIMYIATAIF